MSPRFQLVARVQGAALTFAALAAISLAPTPGLTAQELPQIAENRAFKVLGVEEGTCGIARCLEFTILCKRNFYHGRIAGLLLRGVWYGPDGTRQRTTVNQDGNCGIGGDITRTHVLIPEQGSAYTYAVESLFD